MESQTPPSSWTEQELNLREYLDVLVRRRATIVVCALIAGAGAFLYSLSQTPLYTASATVQIEQEQKSFLNFEDMWNSWASRDSFYQTQFRLLQSRAVGGRVVEALGLVAPAANDDGASADGLSQPTAADFVHDAVAWVSALPSMAQRSVRQLIGTAATEPDADELAAMQTEDPAYRSAVNRVLGGLSVQPIGNTTLARVSWTSSDPMMAARIANAVVDEYIEHSLEAKFQASTQATDFLITSISQLRDEVADDEAELQSYGNERDILSADENQDTVTQNLQELNSEYLSAQTERVQRQITYEQLREADPSTVPEVFTNQVVQTMKTDLASLINQRSDLARRFTEEHPDMVRLQAQIDDLEAQITAEEQRIFTGVVANAEQLYEIARDRENRLSGMLRQQREDTRDLNRDLVRYRQLQNEIESKKELLSTMLQRLNEANVSSRLQGSMVSSIRKIDTAGVPRSPSSPDTRQNLLYGLAMGLLAGLGLALFQEHLDNSVKSPEDVEHRLGLPTLAWIPALEAVSNGKSWSYGYGGDGAPSLDSSTSPELIVVEQPRSTIAEAYRSLRTAVLLSRAGKPPEVLLTTSSVPGEGKTTTTLNMAASLAQAGKRVLLIDADMRRPRVGRILGLDSKHGLTSFLTGACTLRQAVQATDVENLWAMPCGTRPPNPAELLVSPRLADMIAKLRDSFDAVLIDTPPIMAVTDPLILAPHCDGVAIVVRGGQTPYPMVQQALRKVHDVGGKVLGIVLNNVGLDRLRYHAYYGKAERADNGEDADEVFGPVAEVARPAAPPADNTVN